MRTAPRAALKSASGQVGVASGTVALPLPLPNHPRAEPLSLGAGEWTVPMAGEVRPGGAADPGARYEDDKRRK